MRGRRNRVRHDPAHAGLLAAASLPLLPSWDRVAVAVEHRLLPTPWGAMDRPWFRATGRRLVVDFAITIGRALDRGACERALACRLPPLRRLSRITMAQRMPCVRTAARTGLSLVWKIVRVFHVPGSDGRVDVRVGAFFRFLDIAGILARTLAFMTVAMAFEHGVARPLQSRIPGWRPARRSAC
jgi:ABC-type nitrate/sulfonate/bicarbonate transport system permease component